MNFQKRCLEHLRDTLDIKWALSHNIIATIRMHEYTIYDQL